MKALFKNLIFVIANSRSMFKTDWQNSLCIVPSCVKSKTKLTTKKNSNNHTLSILRSIHAQNSYGRPLF